MSSTASSVYPTSRPTHPATDGSTWRSARPPDSTNTHSAVRSTRCSIPPSCRSKSKTRRARTKRSSHQTTDTRSRRPSTPSSYLPSASPSLSTAAGSSKTPEPSLARAFSHLQSRLLGGRTYDESWGPSESGLTFTDLWADTRNATSRYDQSSFATSRSPKEGSGPTVSQALSTARSGLEGVEFNKDTDFSKYIGSVRDLEDALFPGQRAYRAKVRAKVSARKNERARKNRMEKKEKGQAGSMTSYSGASTTIGTEQETWTPRSKL